MRTVLAAALAAAMYASPAAAQMVVHDPLNYASLIHQAETALSQLNELKAQVGEAQKLYAGFNDLSHVNSLATGMATPALRAFVPDIDAYVAAAKGDLAALGEIGRKAADLRTATRLYTAAPDDALGQDLEHAGDRAARDIALGQQAASVGARRLNGLQELTTALDSATSVRAVLDLQARISAEQAMTANDQMRLQGLAMAQEAEARLQAQRDRERAAASADARMRVFKGAFQ